jgi:hypothetical protein
MKRSCIFIYLLFFSVLCFAQQNAGIRVIGRIPDATDNNLYQMQVGAFKVFQNASNAYEKLRAASLNPSYEEYTGLTRVLIKGVKAKDVPSYIERIRRAGFLEVFIKIDRPSAAAAQLPSVTTQSSSYDSSSYDSPEDLYISESQPDMPQQNNGAENIPRSWKLTGRDPAGTEWKADIVVTSVRNNNYEGYFDWYMSPDFDYQGREYFIGQFDKNTDKITFQGTRLENSQNLVLGKYEAYVSINRDKLYNGRWEEPDEIPVSDWQASKEE